MFGLFHAIYFIFTKLSLPAWQRDVRRITYDAVEAIKEAEQNKTSSV